jgi:hypothetical protein
MTCSLPSSPSAIWQRGYVTRCGGGLAHANVTVLRRDRNVTHTERKRGFLPIRFCHHRRTKGGDDMRYIRNADV